MAEFLVDIEKELRSSYLAYSLSVIIGRAIPDARDGLKPVHRRILYAQSQMSNTYNRPTKKSARVVGDVIGKYHPHGDTAVYDALVRMAQDFNMRDPLEEGQGNFGSLDGDRAAAMRYTEVRMSKLASEFLNDIEKKTVDFHPNYDGSEQEPEVLPTKVPNLLLNGSSGIAVGMATNIPPHNLGELCDGLLRLIDDPECSVEELMQSVKGPDFPTAGFVYAGQGLKDAYHTGRGVIKVRGRVEIKEQSKTQQIVIREIPYGVNKGELVKKIAELVNDKKIDGVTDLKDLSDKKGIRIIVALRRGTIPEMVLNGLYKYTQLESSFGINMLAVVDNKPQQLNLRTALGCFLDHRREVVIRRTRFDLEKAQFRSHILEGLLKALDIIDEIIDLIRSSETPPIAKKGLVDQFGFSEVQAQSILDMRLQRLTGLEREKILEEFNELQKLIVYLTSILEDVNVLRGVLREETQYIKDTYATPRRTEIVYESLEGIEVEDLIPDDDVVITLSRRGYIKRTTLANYQQQKRGGKGIAGLHTSEDDFVQEFLTTTNHQYLLLFTNKGRMYQLKVHQVPEGSRTAKGVHIANLLPMEKDEWVANALTVREFSESSYFLFATKKGVVKRSVASDYSHCRRSGMIALGLKEGDELIAVREVIENDHVVLATSQGMAIRFALSGVRPMGRIAAGVKGISLRSDDSVVACVVVRQDDETTKIMTISSLGYGKRTKVDLYRVQSRGGIGLINFKASPKTGPVIGAMPVSDTDSLVLLTSTNKIIRLGVDDIRSIGRATMGVRLVKLDEGATVAGFDKVEESGEDSI
ncbi:MAG: DNA gyrase subunit A [Mailhella sp.]|nr:DNA gyrase subunit A [Mailhella sp.]